MIVSVYDLSGKKTGKINLPEEIFKAKIRPSLMAQAVRVYLANQRQGTQEAKTRGEVTGSGRKIYRQKGTGGARHGDRYAPIFVGGGVAFPPKPRDFSLKLSTKMKRLALFSALSQKLNDKSVFIVSGLDKVAAKTKDMVKVLDNLILEDKKEAANRRIKTLIVMPKKIDNLILAARNIEGVALTPFNLLNTYIVLNSDRLVFSTDSIKKLPETFLGKETKKSPSSSLRVNPVPEIKKTKTVVKRKTIKKIKAK